MTFLIGAGIFLGLPIIVGLLIFSLVMIVEQPKHQETDTATSGSDSLVCSIDADCPTGFICVNGECVPRKKLNNLISPAG